MLPGSCNSKIALTDQQDGSFGSFQGSSSESLVSSFTLPETNIAPEN